MRQAPAKAANVCLTSLRLFSADVGTGCATSNFEIGFLDDDDWCGGDWWGRAS